MQTARTIPHAVDFPGCSAEALQLLDLACDAILVRDMDRTINFWSRGAEVVYGWAKSEAVGARSTNC
jgi:PAS domain-containing protein